MRSAFPSRFRHFQWLAVLLLVTGCADRSVRSIPTIETAPAFTQSGDLAAPNRWWTAFGDDKLNQYVSEALTDNYSLAAAAYRVRSARAVTRNEASDFWPDIDGTVGLSTRGGPGDNFETYELGLSGNYQVDLWGEIQSRVDAQRYRAIASCFDYHAIGLALSAEITSTWFSLIEAHAQADLVKEQIEANRTGLTLQEQRFGLGLIGSADVFRQRQLLESTLEQQAINESEIAVLEHQLATLLGEMPQGASYQPGTTFPELPPLPATGFPAELLLRRPDIQTNYHALLAADRDLASAISMQFPRLNLFGTLQTLTENPETLLRDWVVTIGGQLITPLIDGGQRRAEVDRTDAVKQELFNNWAQSVLEAFREVEDNLALEKFQIQRIEHLDAQVKLAGQAAGPLREQYLIGDADYLDVLSNITGQQSLQRDLLQAQLDLRLIRVSLYLAIAGSIEPRQSGTFPDRVELLNRENVFEELDQSVGSDEPQVPDIPEKPDVKNRIERAVQDPPEPVEIPDRDKTPLLNRIRGTTNDE